MSKTKRTFEYSSNMSIRSTSIIILAHFVHSFLNRYAETRRELQNTKLSLSKLIWQWIPERIPEFKDLRARNHVNVVEPLSIGGSFGKYTLTGEVGRYMKLFLVLHDVYKLARPN